MEDHAAACGNCGSMRGNPSDDVVTRVSGVPAHKFRGVDKGSTATLRFIGLAGLMRGSMARLLDHRHVSMIRLAGFMVRPSSLRASHIIHTRRGGISAGAMH